MAAALFTWRVSCEWLGGVHSRSTVETFFGTGAEQSHKTLHSVEADHPGVFAAPANGATPVEIVLSALASCLTAGIASVAQNRGIQLRSVTARVEGDMHLYGVLGIDPDVRNGFDAIRVTFDIDVDATKDEISCRGRQSEALRHHHQPRKRAGRRRLTRARAPSRERKTR
jgi:uncharacterized OsmC-like protein